MSTGYEVATLYKGKTAPPNAGQGDVFVDQTTSQLSVHNGLRFDGAAFSSVDISGTLTVAGGIATGAVNVSSGNLLFGATAQRITGDLSNATFASRLAFQGSTVNVGSTLGILPNGIATNAAWTASNTSDPDNAGRVLFGVNGTSARILTSAVGTGTEPATIDLISAIGTLLSIATATGIATFNRGLTVAAGAFQFSNGMDTVVGGGADKVLLGAQDLSAGNCTLAIGTETAVTAAAAGASDAYLNIKINGSTYKLLLHT